VLNLDGFIMADGEPDQGAVFTFYIPARNGNESIARIDVVKGADKSR
jgi:hypothetical protein